MCTVVVELLCTIGDFDALLFADELVVGAFVNILKAAPPADVVDEHVIEIGLTRLNILNQFDSARPPSDPKATAPLIKVGSYDGEVFVLRIGGDGGGLVLYRITLKLG